MIIIYTTFPDKKSADSVVIKLLKNRLAACAQLFPIESTYWWKGKIENSTETGAFIKTKKSLGKKVGDFISKNHPYEAPEVVTLSPDSVNKSYFDWLQDSI